MTRLCLFCPHYIQLVFHGFQIVWFVHNSFDVLPGCLFLLEILGQHWDRGSWGDCEQNSAGGISAQLSPGNDDVKWLYEIFWLLTSLVLEGRKLCSCWVEASVPLLVIVDVWEREGESSDEEEDNPDVGDEQTSSLLYSFLWKDWFGVHCWTIMEESISCDLEIWGKDPVRRCPMLYSLLLSCLHALLIMIGLTYLIRECEFSIIVAIWILRDSYFSSKSSISPFANEPSWLSCMSCFCLKGISSTGFLLVFGLDSQYWVKEISTLNMKRLQTFAKPQNLSNDEGNKKELSDTGVPGKEPLSKGVAWDKD